MLRARHRLATSGWPFETGREGALAQLVERFNGIEEVSGSTPLRSTSLRHPGVGARIGGPIARGVRSFFQAPMKNVLFALVLLIGNAMAGPAADLAAKLDGVQTGSSLVRLKMTIQDPPGTATETLQLQIKERRTDEKSDVLYQILFPRERKAEAVLLSQSGDGGASGYHAVPPSTVTPIPTADLDGSLFGGDLAYRDVIENFFAWDGQAIVGTEEVDGRMCEILESKPGGGQSSSYGSVRSWIDDRAVPLRVEKYDSAGRLVRRIDTTRVHKDDDGRYIPASIIVRRPGASSITEFEGSRSRGDIGFSDEDFTVEKMGDLTSPR